jgi:hypothetical protein
MTSASEKLIEVALPLDGSSIGARDPVKSAGVVMVTRNEIQAAIQQAGPVHPCARTVGGDDSSAMRYSSHPCQATEGICFGVASVELQWGTSIDRERCPA